MVNWADHRLGANPLNYIAMIGFDHARLGLPADLPGTGPVAAALIDAGAPVDGLPGDSETPLITAASYGDAELARALIEAGANIEARASTDAGGVPGGTALMHAAVFGMTEVWICWSGRARSRRGSRVPPQSATSLAGSPPTLRCKLEFARSRSLPTTNGSQ